MIKLCFHFVAVFLYCIVIAESALATEPTPASEPAPAGVGMLLTLNKPGHFVVQYLLPDMPAARADVKIGDAVLAVDGVAVDNIKTVEDLVDKIRGASGSTVKLKIQSGDKTRDIALVRGTIPNVKSPATDDFRREVSVYFYQTEDLIKPKEPVRSVIDRYGIYGDQTVRDFLRSQLTRRVEH